MAAAEGKGPVKELKSEHQKEGFGISWNPNLVGQLATATDKQIGLWDVEAKAQPVYFGDDRHDNHINDLKFNQKNVNILVSVGDDSNAKIWDVRAMQKSQNSYKCSNNEINAVCFSPATEHMFATAGDSSGIVQVWDLRMMQNCIIDFLHHKESANVLDWSSTDSNLLASGSNDQKVFLWDIRKAGEEQGRGDYEEGPPELLFPHECHDDSIEAISFSPQNLNYLATADQAGCVQVWKMRADVQESLSDLGEEIHDSDLE